jgi:meso-butanediol dehydrogenase/(S,S)-butanediol dehydrogenase/diacetyl reductase
MPPATATPKSLFGKTAIVTGASSGIGRAIAETLGGAGAHVFLAGRTRAAMDASRKTIDEAGGKAEVEVLDVRDVEAVRALVEQAVRKTGRLDVMVNNAGIFKGSTVTKTRPEEWQEVMDTNAGGVFNGSRAALPHLIKSGGCIVNTASVSGLGGDWATSAYNASKGAVANLTKAMAMDYGRQGVRVNSVCPSFTLTDMTEDMARNKKLVAKFMERMPAGRIIMPADVAAVIAFLASDDARMVTGVNLPVDGGVTASNGQPNME